MNPYLYHQLPDSMSPPLGPLYASHFVESYGYYGRRPHGTKDWLLIYTVSGEGAFRVDQEVQLCGPGDAVILPPGTPHHYATPEGKTWELLWVHFLPQPEWMRWLQLPRIAGQLIYMRVADPESRGRIEGAFARLIADCRSMNKLNEELARIALAEILAILYREHAKSRMNVYDERVEEVLHYFAERLADKHTLAELAAKVSLSESRLGHLFKLQVGKGVMDTLLAMRLQKAAKLLELTGRPIGDIAAEVGFESPFYFARRFRAFFGVSPTAHRKYAQEQWRYDGEP